MDFNKLIQIRRGYKFVFDTPTIMSIKRSPKEKNAMICEHQYGVKYRLKKETHEYQTYECNGIECEWKLNHKTYELYVKIGLKWEIYLPGEYVIKVLC